MNTQTKRITGSSFTACATTPGSATAPAPANDNAGPGRTADTTALLARRDVTRYLAATLRRYGVAREDMADAIADVQTDALEVARYGRMPADVAQWKALTAAIAARWAIDRLREGEAHARYDAGLCDDADAHPLPMLHSEQRDPVDTKRYLAILKDLFDSGQMPPKGAEILWGEAEEVPYKEIAAEVGVSDEVVRKRLLRMRTKFRTRLASLGMLVIVLLILMALLVPLIEVAAPAPDTRSPEPPPSARCVPRWDGGPPIVEKSSFGVSGNCALSD